MVQYYMLASMCNALQRHEDMEPRVMLLHLMELFVEQNRTERYKILHSLFRARMAESSSVQAYVLKIIEGIERLAMLEVERLVEMITYVILQSLINSFS